MIEQTLITIIIGLSVIAILCVLSIMVANFKIKLRRSFLVAELSRIEAEKNKLMKNLQEQPQSGFWITCQYHGNLPLTQEEYDRQNRAEKYGCPICKQMPKRIWRQCS